MGLMAQPCQRTAVARISTAAVLVAVAVVCPLMATGAMPAAPSCHERTDHDGHEDSPAVDVCCAVVKGVASLPWAPDDAAEAPSAVERAPELTARGDSRHDYAQPRTTAPPLFLRHAALLI